MFDRFHGRVGLTSAGEIFLAKAENILHELAEVGRVIQTGNGVEKGKVSLGVSPNIAPDFLPSRLTRYAREHVHVEVQVVEEVTSLLVEYLLEGLIDLALVVLPLGAAISKKDLSCIPLMREPLYAALPTGHRLAARKSMTLQDLQGERFVFLKDGRCYSENIASAFRRAKLHPNVVAESASIPHVLAMACSGVGVSVVPKYALDLRRKNCEFVPIAGKGAFSEIGLVHDKRRSGTRALASFTKFLRETAREKKQRAVGTTA